MLHGLPPAMRSLQAQRTWTFPPFAARSVAALVLSLLLAAASLLLARRAIGALAVPLPALMLLAVGAGTALLVVLIRKLVSLGGTSDLHSPAEQALQWGPTAAVGMLGMALSMEGAARWALVLFWAVMIAADIWSERIFRPVLVRRKKTEHVSADEPGPALEAEEVPHWHSWSLEDSSVGLPRDAELRQQITRFRTISGEEVVSGVVHAELLPGDRSGYLHVAFCPPLANVPELHLEQAGGPAARIKAAQVQPYGARFEYRLNEPLEAPARLAVEFTAIESSQQAAE